MGLTAGQIVVATDADHIETQTAADVRTILGVAPSSDTAYDATSWNGNTDVPTKNAVRDKFESLSPGGGNITADVYIANITQTGVGDPTATVGDNTLGGTVVWTRDSLGLYYGTLTGAFAGTIIFTHSIDNQGSAYAVFPVKISDNQIRIYSYDSSGGSEDLDGATVGLAIFKY